MGNPAGGDDRVGHEIVAGLRDSVPEGVEVLALAGADPAVLMEAWADADRAIVIDAMVSEAPPGTVQRFDVTDDPLPADVRVPSTHSFGVDAAVEMARALGKLPSYVSVYGIEGREFAIGAGLSEAVGAAVLVAAEMILEEIAAAVG